jgi:hypothetical protein
MKRVLVTINKLGKIPGVGKGPIRKPTLISENLYNMLKKLGYDIKIVEQPAIKKPEPIKAEIKEEKPVITETVVDDKVEEVTTETVEEAPVVNEEELKPVEVESVVEETITDELEEGILINDSDLKAESYYEEDFLQSKNMCKKILDNRNVQYDNKASFAMLKQLVAESNPEVEIVEEETTTEE